MAKSDVNISSSFTENFFDYPPKLLKCSFLPALTTRNVMLECNRGPARAILKKIHPDLTSVPILTFCTVKEIDHERSTMLKVGEPAKRTGLTVR
ncbi:MAG TPA: hypothetical protein VGP06_15585 [Janthinobacterium sp.]|jgi:hypothetical protein|nr:hypothetical protein [Janthinobacterium sp.]